VNASVVVVVVVIDTHAEYREAGHRTGGEGDLMH
jgi:hypothetical protein